MAWLFVQLMRGRSVSRTVQLPPVLAPACCCWSSDNLATSCASMVCCEAFPFVTGYSQSVDAIV